MAGFENDILVCKNINFDTAAPKPHLGIITAAGEIPIGTGNTSPTPEILAGSITSPNGSITVGYSSPDITLEVASGDDAVLTLTGNTGGAQSPTAGNIDIVTENSTVVFEGTTSSLNLDFGLSNLSLGSSLPSLTTGEQNVSLGILNLESITSGSQNTAIGYRSGNLLETGSSNTVVGHNSFLAATSANNNCGIGSAVLSILTTGTGNTACGHNVLTRLTTGVANTVLGSSAGFNYQTSESSNILIKNIGVVGDSNTIRIGSQGGDDGQQNRAFMAGITGVTVAASEPMGVDTNGQLSALGFGTEGQIFTSNGAATSPTWQDPVTGTTANSAIAQGSAVALTTATNADITSFSLDEGTWVITGIVQFGGTPTVSGPQRASISTTSVTHGNLGDNSFQCISAGNCPITVPSYILTLGSTTTVYLVASGVFSGGTMNAYGRLSAIRIS